MSTYESSKKTYDALVNSAGELAAEVGFPNVSTRAVAERAGKNIGSIHYHFGSKEKLFEAVIRKVIQHWNLTTAEDLLAGYEDHMNTLEGQSRIIRVLVHRYVSVIFDPENPRWYSRVVYQVLQWKSPLHDLLNEEFLNIETKAMVSFFRRINPKLSYQEAILHMLVLITPISFHADYRESVLEKLGETSYGSEYLQKMEDLIVAQTQLYLGLPRDKQPSFGV